MRQRPLFLSSAEITQVSQLPVDSVAVLKQLKRELGCNGTVRESPSGSGIGLPGDRRSEVWNFLLAHHLCIQEEFDSRDQF